MSASHRSLVVVIADQVSDSAVTRLTEDHLQVHDLHESGIPEERLIETLTKLSAAALIVRSATRVTGTVLRAASHAGLRVVARAGVGVDNIDCEAAQLYGVLVVNAPEGNTLSAAEHTCALMMAISRQFPTAFMHRFEDWGSVKKRVAGDLAPFPITELFGKTLGVIGLGRIGSAVGKRMHAFGMRVIGHDPLTVAFQRDRKLPFWLSALIDLDDLLAQSDYLTIHTPLLPKTKELLNEDRLARCRPGFRLINCSRGGIVHEPALVAALESGHCVAAALDVFEYEPPISTDPAMQKLQAHPSVLLTPHLGASSREAQVRVAVEVADAIRALSGSPNISHSGLEGAVNINALGKRCRSLFPSWINSVGPFEVHNFFYLISAIHYVLKQIYVELSAAPAQVDNPGISVYRITALLASNMDMWCETKHFLADWIAYTCQQLSDSCDSFHVSSVFLQSELLECATTVDPINGAVEITWTDPKTGRDSICSVLFVHSLSCLDVTERQLFGTTDQRWRFSVSTCSVSSEMRPRGTRLANTKVAQLQNGHVHICDDRGIPCSEGVPLSALI